MNVQTDIFSDGTCSCALCGKTRFTKVADKLRTGENYKVYKCTFCEHVQLLPRPSMEDDREYYNKDLQEKAIRSNVNLDNQRANSEYDVKRRADFIAGRFPMDSVILDIGCGYGFFLEEMSHRGYMIRGVEVSKERRERRDLARTIIDCDIFDINFIEEGNPNIEKVDIATLFHVLEHTSDPIGFLRNIKSVLKKNGCLIVEVPNVEELMLDTCPEYNDFYWIRAHLHYFNNKTLDYVLKKAGFKKIEIVYVQRYGVKNLCNWLMTGRPQLERPVFKMDESYQWLEDYYRKYLEKIGRTDAIMAIARKH